MTPCNIVGMSLLNGLDFIAITDHNCARNVKAVMEAAKGEDIIIIPGMEVETAEEIHVVTLFESIDALYEMEKLVLAALPPLKNRVEIFGNQIVYDKDDNILEEEQRMLITATTLSIDDVFGCVKEFGGIAIPAHVDRSSYSIISNLGFFPENLNITTFEFSKKADIPAFFAANKSLKNKYNYLTSSDAHYLTDLDVTHTVNVEMKTISALIEALRQ